MPRAIGQSCPDLHDIIMGKIFHVASDHRHTVFQVCLQLLREGNDFQPMHVSCVKVCKKLETTVWAKSPHPVTRLPVLPNVIVLYINNLE